MLLWRKGSRARFRPLYPKGCVGSNPTSSTNESLNIKQNMYSSVGKLRYSEHYLVVDVDSGIVELARALVPKALYLNRQRYAPHISVVRHEKPVVLKNWGKHEGREVEFKYSTYVYNDEVYYWLQAFSPTLSNIRVELGLSKFSEWSRPPDGQDCFHITIGNTKKV